MLARDLTVLARDRIVLRRTEDRRTPWYAHGLSEDQAAVAELAGGLAGGARRTCGGPLIYDGIDVMC